MTQRVVKDFTHTTGIHCGSTAMADLLRHAGHDLSEAMVFGLGSGLGFYYIKSKELTPSRQVFGRAFNLEESAAEALGLELRAHFEADNEAAWQGVRAAIDADQPALVQCDLSELPYWESNTPFNGHKIAVVGYDEDAEYALVADTHFEGLQRVPLDALERARASKAPPSMGNQNVWWLLEPGEARPLNGAVEHALATNAEQMEHDTTGFGGLEALEDFAEEVGSWSELEDASWVYRFAYQCIEKRGTGGGNFRYLYRDFLREATPHVDRIRRDGLVISMTRTADAWSTLSRYLEAMSRWVEPIAEDGADDRPDDDPSHHLESMAEAVYQFESTYWDRAYP